MSIGHEEISFIAIHLYEVVDKYIYALFEIFWS